MAWDTCIEGFLYVKIVLRLGMTQGYIWDLSIIGGYSDDQQLKRELIQAFLEDKQFLAGRTVMSPINNFVKGNSQF